VTINIFSSPGYMLIKKQSISSELNAASVRGTKRVVPILSLSDCLCMLALPGLFMVAT